MIGNPPYKEEAKGRGGWVEEGHGQSEGILNKWIPPPQWEVSAHSKHLRNLYIYFWRWATWKVFDHDPNENSGVVCFITVAGFLNGPGFQKMRDYLRRTTDEMWVIDVSPEGHQPKVNRSNRSNPRHKCLGWLKVDTFDAPRANPMPRRPSIAGRPIARKPTDGINVACQMGQRFFSF